MVNDATTDTGTRDTHGHSFALGLLTGGIIGGVVALAFAPRAGAALRRRVADTARSLGAAASGRCQDASARVSDAVGQFASTARVVRDDAADAVASGARDLARVATSTES